MADAMGRIATAATLMSCWRQNAAMLAASLISCHEGRAAASSTGLVFSHTHAIQSRDLDLILLRIIASPAT